MKRVAIRLRIIAFRLLPVLVAVWAAVAVLGGALYLAKHTDSPGSDAAVKAGLGLCAVSVAVLAGKVARRITTPPLMAGIRSVLSPLCSRCLLLRPPLGGTPAKGPPMFVLLQVCRT